MPSTPATVFCPLERSAVDVERCAACPWRTAERATCVGAERAEARDWISLLRLVP